MSLWERSRSRLSWAFKVSFADSGLFRRILPSVSRKALGFAPLCRFKAQWQNPFSTVDLRMVRCRRLETESDMLIVSYSFRQPSACHSRREIGREADVLSGPNLVTTVVTTTPKTAHFRYSRNVPACNQRVGGSSPPRFTKFFTGFA